MSDLGKIKPAIRPTAIRPLHREPEKEQTRQQKKEKKNQQSQEQEQTGNINEYI